MTIKDYLRESRLFNRRVLIIGGGALLLIAALLGRLIYLQVNQYHLYSALSLQNEMRLIPIAPNRGLIYDRNGKLLAEDLPVFSLDIVPEHIKHLTKTILALQKIIPLNTMEIDQFYKSLKQHPPYIPVPLKLELTEAEIAKFYVNRYRFPGVFVEARMLRYYPYGPALANVIGHVGRINKKELNEIDPKNYSASEYIGKTGIEQFYEKQLHGQVGYQEVEIDANGQVVKVLKHIPATSGNNLYLTIDAGLQVTAQQALGKIPGAVVAIDPNTGQILAMASNPSYDPNAFVLGMTNKAYQQLLNQPARPLFNRDIRGQYPTGSTIKPFLALEGLDKGYITPTTTIYDPGWFQLPNTTHVFHDWEKHGEVNVTKAIIVSCDTFFYKLAVKMGIDNLDDTMDLFGFGQHTGIDLIGELPGLIPSPAWKLSHIGKPWYTGDTVITGIGQGYLLATPLQLADGVATIAERGQRHQPYLLLKLQQPDGQIDTTQPTTETPVVLAHPDIWNTVINAMAGVINSTNPPGTGFRFGHAPYTVAGKTGTAQVSGGPSDYRFMSTKDWPSYIPNDELFIAFAPINNPQIAVAVIAEHNPNAPLIARKVMDYYLLTENHLPTNNGNNAAPTTSSATQSQVLATTSKQRVAS